MTQDNTLQASREKARQIWILVLVPLAAFMVAIDATVVATALSTIRRDLGTSLDQLEWIVNAYNLSFAVLLITAAALGDRFGRKRMFVAGLALFIAASAACALSRDVTWLIVARAIQGCGAALVFPLALTQLSAAFPPERRGRALGIFSGVVGLAVIAGPILGGIIAGGLAWQWIFWINVPIGLIVIVLVLIRLQESFGARIALDFGGLLSVSGAALGLMWGLVRGNSAGWGSLEVVATLGVGVLLTIVFVVWELRVRAPMVPMYFFRSRTFSAGNVANFMLNASLTGAVFFVAQFLQVAHSYGPLDSGLRLLPLTAPVFVIAPLAGALVNRIGTRFLIVVGFLLETVGLAWIGLIASPSHAYPEFVIPLIISGIGVSMTLPPLQNAIINTVTANEIGKASGTLSMFRQLGAAFGVAILAAVFAGFGNFSSPQAFSNGFAVAIGVAAALSLLGAIAGLVQADSRAVSRQVQAQSSKNATDDTLEESLSQ
ncbi:MAG TPA: MFS transporter [Ktedonobacteraceae bacterium]